eukprot:g10018.t1
MGEGWEKENLLRAVTVKFMAETGMAGAPRPSAPVLRQLQCWRLSYFEVYEDSVEVPKGANFLERAAGFSWQVVINRPRWNSGGEPVWFYPFSMKLAAAQLLVVLLKFGKCKTPHEARESLAKLFIAVGEKYEPLRVPERDFVALLVSKERSELFFLDHQAEAVLRYVPAPTKKKYMLVTPRLECEPSIFNTVLAVVKEPDCRCWFELSEEEVKAVFWGHAAQSLCLAEKNAKSEWMRKSGKVVDTAAVLAAARFGEYEPEQVEGDYAELIEKLAEAELPFGLLFFNIDSAGEKNLNEVATGLYEIKPKFLALAETKVPVWDVAPTAKGQLVLTRSPFTAKMATSNIITQKEYFLLWAVYAAYARHVQVVVYYAPWRVPDAVAVKTYSWLRLDLPYVAEKVADFVQEIEDAAEEGKREVIVAGDFNVDTRFARASDPPPPVFDAVWRPFMTKFGSRHGEELGTSFKNSKNWGTSEQGACVDHIYSTYDSTKTSLARYNLDDGAVEELTGDGSDTIPSDHAALFFEFPVEVEENESGGGAECEADGEALQQTSVPGVAWRLISAEKKAAREMLLGLDPFAEKSCDKIATGYADFVYPAPADVEAVEYVGGRTEVADALCEGYPYRVTMTRGDAFDAESFASKCAAKLAELQLNNLEKLPNLIRLVLRVLTDEKVVPGKFIGGAGKSVDSGSGAGGSSAETGGAGNEDEPMTEQRQEFRSQAVARQKAEEERKARLHARSQQWLAELADVVRSAKAGHRVFGAARRWTATQKGQKRGDPASELAIVEGGWCQSRTAEAATRLAPLVHTKKAEALFKAAVGGSQQDVHFPPMSRVFDELLRVARSLPKLTITRTAVRNQVQKMNGELRAPSGMRAKVLRAFLHDESLLSILHTAVQSEVNRPTTEDWKGNSLQYFIKKCYKRFSGRYLRKSAKSFAVESLRLVVSAEPFCRVIVQLLIDGGVRLFRERKQNGLATIGAMSGVSLDITRFFWDQSFEPILKKTASEPASSAATSSVAANPAAQSGAASSSAAAGQAVQGREEGIRKIGLVLIIDSANQFNTEGFVRLLQCGRQVGMHPTALLFLLAANWKKEVMVANGAGLAKISEHDDLVIGSPEALFVSLVMQAAHYEAVRWFFELIFEGTTEEDEEAPPLTKIQSASKKVHAWLAEQADALNCYSKHWREYTHEDVDDFFKNPGAVPGKTAPFKFSKEETAKWKKLFAAYDVKLCIDDAGIKLCLPRWTIYTGFAQEILKRALGFVELCFKHNELFVAPDKFKLLVLSLAPEPEKEKIASTLVASCRLLGIRPQVKFTAKLVGTVYSDAPLTSSLGQLRRAIGHARWICGNTRKSLGYWLAGGDVVDIVQYAHISAVLHHFAALQGRTGYVTGSQAQSGLTEVRDLEEEIAGGMAIELGFDQQAMAACVRRSRARSPSEVVFSEMIGIERPPHTAERVVDNMVCKWAAATGDKRAGERLAQTVEANADDEARAHFRDKPESVLS